MLDTLVAALLMVGITARRIDAARGSGADPGILQRQLGDYMTEARRLGATPAQIENALMLGLE